MSAASPDADQRVVRPFPYVTLLLALAVVGLLIATGIATRSLTHERRVTARSLSPDDRLLVELHERPAYIDRNFFITLRDRYAKTDASTVIFESPDEGRPICTEYFLWSADGRSVLLVGRHFYTKPELRLANGEIVYLLYDTQSGQLWCNARERPNLARIDESLLRQHGFSFAITTGDEETAKAQP
jgi:hypothetical protein